MRDEEYKITGEHLKKINPNWTFEDWSYRHTFVAKMKYIDKLLSKIDKSKKIFDAGSGQGLLVKKYREKGYDIVGMDLSYENNYVMKGNILKTGIKPSTYDIILNLDVIEHLDIQDHENLIKEFHRILKPGGQLIMSIPNLAHLSSRLLFLFTGKLIRTAKAEYHPSDRPIKEHIAILKKYFKVKKIKGISPTIPIIFQLTQLFPRYTYWLYSVNSIFSFMYNWCFNCIIICEKE